MSDWKPVQCPYGPHWHEQPGAEEQVRRCWVVMRQFLWSRENIAYWVRDNYEEKKEAKVVLSSEKVEEKELVAV